MPDKAERVGILRGEVSLADEKLISDLVRRLGLRVAFLSPEEHQTHTPKEGTLPGAQRDKLKPVDTLGTIRSTDDFVFREHFYTFWQSSMSRESRQQILGRAFNYLVDSRSTEQLSEHRQWSSNEHRWIDEGQPIPYPGLVVRDREELGFVPAQRLSVGARSQELARFAIQAGSLIDAQPYIAQDFATSSTKEFTLAFINEVAGQILNP